LKDSQNPLCLSLLLDVCYIVILLDCIALMILAKSTNLDAPHRALNCLHLRFKYFPEHCSVKLSVYGLSLFSVRDKVSNLHKTAGRITVGISVFSYGKWKAENTVPFCVVLHYCNDLYMAQFAKHCICSVLILLIHSFISVQPLGRF